VQGWPVAVLLTKANIDNNIYAPNYLYFFQIKKRRGLIRVPLVLQSDKLIYGNKKRLGNSQP
jgi:hypothetical protein